MELINWWFKFKANSGFTVSLFYMYISLHKHFIILVFGDINIAFVFSIDKYKYTTKDFTNHLNGQKSFGWTKAGKVCYGLCCPQEAVIRIQDNDIWSCNQL